MREGNEPSGELKSKEKALDVGRWTGYRSQTSKQMRWEARQTEGPSLEGCFLPLKLKQFFNILREGRNKD